MSEENQNYSSVEKIWSDYINLTTKNTKKDIPLSFYFCDNETDANDCADLVVKGIKRATATSLWWFEKNKEELPRVGNQYIVTDWDGNARAIIETVQIDHVPYNEVTEEFAETEGEGDKSLKYWKKVHKAYYSREMELHGDQFDENMIIICERFKTIYL